MEGATAQNMNLQSGSGDIHAAISPRANLTMDLLTRWGDLDDQLTTATKEKSREIHQVLNKGTDHLQVHTRSGDVSIQAS